MEAPKNLSQRRIMLFNSLKFQKGEVSEKLIGRCCYKVSVTSFSTGLLSTCRWPDWHV
jgi:hypothetical protein